MEKTTLPIVDTHYSDPKMVCLASAGPWSPGTGPEELTRGQKAADHRGLLRIGIHWIAVAGFEFPSAAIRAIRGFFVSDRLDLDLEGTRQ